jgi:hypothetical protein
MTQTRGIMHLTYPNSDPHIVAAFPIDSGEAGAPANEIEITPEMIHAGECVLLAMDTRFESYEDVVKELVATIFKNSPPGGAYRLKFL